MTTIHEALALAARLTRDAACDGIAVGYVSAFDDAVTLVARDNSLTAALAMSVGAGERIVDPPMPDGRRIEAFKSVIEGVHVSVQGTIPAEAVAR